MFETLSSTSGEHAVEVPSFDPAEVGVGHFVQFYGDDIGAVQAATRFVSSSLAEGGRHLAILTKAHGDQLVAALAAKGFDVDALTEQGRYAFFDADEMLVRILVDGWPDPTRFAKVVGKEVASRISSNGHRPLRVFGEMVGVLCSQGSHAAAVRLEELWNELAKQLRFSLLCAYPMNAFSTTADGPVFEKVCAEHTHVVPAESFTALSGSEAQLRAISSLQQRATALVTETAVRERAESELREKVAALAEMDRRKDEFLAMLGHELRNPLSAIRNALAAASLEPTRRERALDIARRQTDQLTRLVDDLLDVARITQGRLKLSTERIRFATLVRRAIETMPRLSEDRTQTLTISTAAETQEVDGDPIRLEQVIVNLISNARKYTDRGGRIEITVDQDGNRLVLRVRDDGIGIAPEMLSRVFDLFAQAERALDRSHGGLGVGLTVAQRIVELHSGRIEARSDGIGRGAELIVYLPIAPSPTGAVSASPRDTAPVGGRRRVLIVEDNVDAAETLAMLLELYGHEARVACDGETALAVASVNVPDMMIVDIGLPGMDGYEVARRVRLEPTLGRVLLVALTGYGRDEDRQQAVAAGFDRHLVKPVDPGLLKGLFILDREERGQQH